ncbi:bone marrow proteoglycan-like [Manacus candei]|uniref:bone marrow proteoglycan-like n=1 Tax=Manacus candei TaxID=415023 RepID=UPI002227F9B1|nr:bone marrow proteoglycan-like [Manacus candei]
MWPCLLLTLALLGTVPTSHSTPLRGGEAAANLLACPGEGTWGTVGCQGVPGGLGGSRGARPWPSHSGTAGRCQWEVCAGVLRCGWVPAGARCQAVPVPQRYCRDVYRGQLASVHSASRNQELQKLARTYTRISVWIGAVTSCKGGKWASYWEDSSPWNYANWGPTYPHHIVTTCTTLSTRDGLWRSRPCFQLRPFICQY